MSEKKNWDGLYKAASREVLRWRKKHKRAKLTEIEDTIDAELARMRAQMIQDLAMASGRVTVAGQGGKAAMSPMSRPLIANGQQRREYIAEAGKAVFGSGSVESVHKQVVQHRFKQAGMRWAPQNVDPLLTLRDLICN